jgi:hypothetical protein
LPLFYELFPLFHPLSQHFFMYYPLSFNSLFPLSLLIFTALSCTIPAHLCIIPVLFMYYPFLSMHYCRFFMHYPHTIYVLSLFFILSRSFCIIPFLFMYYCHFHALAPHFCMYYPYSWIFILPTLVSLSPTHTLFLGFSATIFITPTILHNYISKLTLNSRLT